MRHKMDRHDSGMYYDEGDTSESDLDSDIEPEPETQAFVTKPIDQILLNLKLRISSPSDLSEKEVANMIKKILSGAQDNKHQKNHFATYLLHIHHPED
ncbi:5781_t:CDS:2 [Acaulospora morrowiae]|uniref:5781_t:CDS:1 n=1 Tax=Acaulospora morrowiae TaxID=94023 RepID=A0A9N9AXT0_9GLOM|nr:5781_t:CDS:2 [Acaulospora morrowiae]